ncbi:MULTISPECIES: response regulator transcription factor [Bacillus cereus group]|uniref:DNA-binding response regulator n=1 Tax=Bacillus cereus TaxID=1396 RepID=A0AA44QDL7_BACCE|nr:MULTISPECIES: response regulator transcription factor [Bacillus cereus group]EEL51787.1 Two-component response regulator [Bacillus cereus Rock3-44]PFN09173.1 DNA-binding response regulator [Bacillus cereus]PFO80049.1 DNA-binding response regulator [Bacillus cereus]PFR24973.1 DNA-binding response regulator [Bacillus cereus]PFS06373.1 DNA-binding response regulator [Bacillus cereus]
MYHANILLIDDETAILQLLTTILQKEGFSHITTATSAEKALLLVEQKHFDLMILDVMLPGQSGFDICPIIRQKTDCPIFFLTAKSSDLDKVSGFLYGADDYITKPFNPLEVVARMKAQLRRHMKQTPQTIKEYTLSFGRVQIDKHAAELQVDGEIVECSAQLFQLLLFFCEHPNYVFSKEEIYEKVWGAPAYNGDDNTVMVHIRKLREKIELDPSNPKYIKTIRGLGYKFVAK